MAVADDRAKWVRINKFYHVCKDVGHACTACNISIPYNSVFIVFNPDWKGVCENCRISATWAATTLRTEQATQATVSSQVKQATGVSSLAISAKTGDVSPVYINCPVCKCSLRIDCLDQHTQKVHSLTPNLIGRPPSKIVNAHLHAKQRPEAKVITPPRAIEPPPQLKNPERIPHKNGYSNGPTSSPELNTDLIRYYKPRALSILEAKKVVALHGIQHLRQLQLDEMRVEDTQKSEAMERGNINPTGASHRSSDLWKDNWNRTHRKE